MNAALIIGLVVGIAAAAAVYALLRAKGYFQYLGGRKRSSIPPVNKETLMGRLLDLNDLSQPFSIIESKETDLVAEWKPASPLPGNKTVTRAYRAYLLLDEARHTVLSYEESGEIRWEKTNDGLRPVVSYRRRLFGGSSKKRRAGINSGRGLEGIKSRLLARVRESGWEWVPVSARRYAIYGQK